MCVRATSRARVSVPRLAARVCVLCVFVLVSWCVTTPKLCEWPERPLVHKSVCFAPAIMANPRKFSEKIALLNQKQAEETVAFEAIMREVSDVTSRVRQSFLQFYSQKRGNKKKHNKKKEDKLSNNPFCHFVSPYILFVPPFFFFFRIFSLYILYSRLPLIH